MSGGRSLQISLVFIAILILGSIAINNFAVSGHLSRSDFYSDEQYDKYLECQSINDQMWELEYMDDRTPQQDHELEELEEQLESCWEEERELGYQAYEEEHGETLANIERMRYECQEAQRDAQKFRNALDLSNNGYGQTADERRHLEELERIAQNCERNLENLRERAALEEAGYRQVVEKQDQCEALVDKRNNLEVISGYGPTPEEVEYINQLNKEIESCFEELDNIKQGAAENDINQNNNPLEQIQNLVQNLVDFIRNLFS